jgi:alpha-methylacyl-CoA racemase
MAALHERQRSGLGQVVDAAMVDGASSLAAIFHGLQAAGSWTAERGANLLDGGAPFYGTFETADGQHISLGALEPKFFRPLAEALGLEARFVQRQYDRRLWPEMRAAIAAAVRLRSRDDWCARLEGTDACFAPVLTFAEAAQHPHAQARNAFVDVAGLVQPAPAPRFSRTPAGQPQPAPTEGQHTAAVLGEAGYTATEIDALIAQGIAR